MIATYIGIAAYAGMIVFLVLCLFTHRCGGVDDQAMIPGEEERK